MRTQSSAAAVLDASSSKPGCDGLGTAGIAAQFDDHRDGMASRQIQITAGRLERNGAPGARFAFVASIPNWTAMKFAATKFDGFLEQQGPNARTAMRVVTDGDDGLRNFVQRSLQNAAEARMWVHSHCASCLQHSRHTRFQGRELARVIARHLGVIPATRVHDAGQINTIGRQIVRGADSRGVRGHMVFSPYRCCGISFSVETDSAD